MWRRRRLGWRARAAHVRHEPCAGPYASTVHRAVSIAFAGAIAPRSCAGSFADARTYASACADAGPSAVPSIADVATRTDVAAIATPASASTAAAS